VALSRRPSVNRVAVSLLSHFALRRVISRFVLQGKEWLPAISKQSAWADVAACPTRCMCVRWNSPAAVRSDVSINIAQAP
jgi:hypothetical protein